MPINENISKWMGVFSFVRDMLQIVGTGSDELTKKSGTGDSGTKQQKIKAPGVFAWFTVEDERIWAELFNALSESERDNINEFLQNLAPRNPGNILEKFAKKVNQGIFRKVVTGLSVYDVGGFLERKLTTGTGKDAKIEEFFAPKARDDHRITFLKTIADMVHKKGTRVVREHLAAANIIISDESMAATSEFITKLAGTSPNLARKIRDYVEQTEKKVSRVCYWIIGTCIGVITVGLTILLAIDHIQ